MCLMGQKSVGFGKECNAKHYYATLITQNNVCLQKIWKKKLCYKSVLKICKSNERVDKEHRILDNLTANISITFYKTMCSRVFNSC